MRQTEHMGKAIGRSVKLAAASFALLAAVAAPADAYMRSGGEGARMIVPATALRSPGGSARIAHIAAETPLTGGSLVLPVIGKRSVNGTGWLRIRIAGRPNGRAGWIPASSARLIEMHWRLRVDLSRRVLVVFRDRRMVKRFPTVVGAPGTPTPTGRFSVIEHLRLEQAWARYGWALALSAYSNVLRSFDGGNGQVAIHARGSLSAPLGTAASHGCIRVADRVARWLALRIPNGTSVDIVR